MVGITHVKISKHFSIFPTNIISIFLNFAGLIPFTASSSDCILLFKHRIIKFGMILGDLKEVLIFL